MINKILQAGKEQYGLLDDFEDRRFSVSLEQYDLHTDEYVIEEKKIDLTELETKDYLDVLKANEPEGNSPGNYLYEYLVFEYDGQSSKSQSEIVSNTRADEWLDD